MVVGFLRSERFRMPSGGLGAVHEKASQVRLSSPRQRPLSIRGVISRSGLALQEWHARDSGFAETEVTEVTAVAEPAPERFARLDRLAE
eukprot:15283603-Alexandrium_andersonii.AAC.1